MSTLHTARPGSDADTFTSQLPAYIAILAATCLGWSSISVQPVSTGVMINHFGMSASEAGLLITFEVVCMTLASLVAVAAMGRFKLLHILLTGAALALCGHLLSSAFDTFDGLAGPRILAGLGEGFCLASGYAAIAALREPERAIALITVGFGLIGIVLLSVLPLSVDKFGPNHLFTALAVMTAILMLFCRRLPETRSGNNKADITADKADQNEPPKNPPQAWIGITAVMLSVFFLALGHSVYWPFLQEVARAASLSDGRIDSIIALSPALGIAGGALAAWVGLRFGRKLPLYSSLAVIAVSLSLSVLIGQALMFSVLLYIYMLLYFFVVPFQKGLLVNFDFSGRALSASSSVTIAALSLGPAVSGFFIDTWGLQAITYLAFPAHLVALATIAWAISRLPKKVLEAKA